STATPIAFHVSGPGRLATTYFLIDQAFVDFNATPPNVYSGTFTLTAGTHTATFFSVDSAGNIESPRVASLTLVTTLPAPPGTYPPGGASVLLVSSTSITVGWGANGNPYGAQYTVAFGTTALSSVTCSISISTSFSTTGTQAVITGLEPSTPFAFNICTAGVEPCAPAIFMQTRASGQDLVVNPPLEGCGGSAPDLTPPVTTLSINGYSNPIEGAAASIYDTSSIELFAAESESGLAQIYYVVDPSTSLLSAGLNAGTTNAFQVYGGAFSLALGRRMLAYGAVDNAGNYEVLQSTAFEVAQEPTSGNGPPT
ncbi:MAG: hypothetical protein COV48_13510, partial [Elusimicrobia bacterium CG11_big_fil_rev_8_21_14_0_20_64_6]